MRGLMLAGLLTVAMACGDDGPTEPVDFTGPTYQLVTVDGQSVPEPINYAVDASTRLTEITSGSLFFRADDKVSIGLSVLVSTNNGTPVAGSFGWVPAYTRSGNTITADLGSPLGVRSATLAVSGGKRTVTVPLGTGLGTLVFREP